MSYVRTIVAAALLTAVGASAHAATFSFTTLDNPADPTFNQLLGINDHGYISGYFGSGAAGHPNKGYVIAPPYTKFNNLDLPASVQTQATGLSADGYVTGFWSDTNLGPAPSGAPQDGNFGFIQVSKAGVATYLDVNNPLVGGAPHINQVLGINVSGVAAGFYVDAKGASHGYTYTISTGKFAALKQASGTVASAATGINKNNLVCGFVSLKSGATLGLLQAQTSGTPITFGVPGSTNTQFLGVDDAGEAVGFFVDANNNTHGVIYNPANGMWQQVDDPKGVGGTVLNGINNKNQAVGFYTDAAGNVHGVVVTITP